MKQRRILMKSMLALSFLALTSLSTLPALSSANQEEHSGKSRSTRTLTGCLSSGEKGEYSLMANDGSTWELHSKTNLSKHVGHTVTVNGSVWHAKMHGAKEKVKDETNPDAHEHGSLKVTSVHHVSDSCNR
jgi:hypothetical protein